MLFQSQYRDYSVVIETPFTPEEQLAYRRFREKDSLGREKDPAGFIIKFNTAKFYNTDMDQRLKGDNNKVQKKFVEDTLKNSPKFGKDWWLYDEGTEKVTLTKSEIDHLVDERVKEAEAQRASKVTTSAGKNAPSFAG